MKAIETTATIKDRKQVLLDTSLPENCEGRVRVLILLPEQEQVNEAEQHSLRNNADITGNVIHLAEQEEAAITNEDDEISSTIQAELKGLFSR